MSQQEILDDFAELSQQDIFQCRPLRLTLSNMFIHSKRNEASA
ncbi:hypothetical protein [Rhodoferax sp.]|nr:hypothetical protein [Rhodoferax sp.]